MTKKFFYCVCVFLTSSLWGMEKPGDEEGGRALPALTLAQAASASDQAGGEAAISPLRELLSLVPVQDHLLTFLAPVDVSHLASVNRWFYHTFAKRRLKAKLSLFTEPDYVSSPLFLNPQASFINVREIHINAYNLLPELQAEMEQRFRDMLGVIEQTGEQSGNVEAGEPESAAAAGGSAQAMLVYPARTRAQKDPLVPLGSLQKVAVPKRKTSLFPATHSLLLSVHDQALSFEPFHFERLRCLTLSTERLDLLAAYWLDQGCAAQTAQSSFATVPLPHLEKLVLVAVDQLNKRSWTVKRDTEREQAIQELEIIKARLIFQRETLLKSLGFLAEDLGIDLSHVEAKVPLEAASAAASPEKSSQNEEGKKWLKRYLAFQCDERDTQGQMTVPYVFKNLLLLAAVEVVGLGDILRYLDRNLQLLKTTGVMASSFYCPPFFDGIVAALPVTAPRLREFMFLGKVTGMQALLPLMRLSSLQKVFTRINRT